nr:hypothetical protein [Legionella oakridgensis]
MLTVGQKLPEFSLIVVKPGFNHHEENGVSAFEKFNENSFPGQWKVIFSILRILPLCVRLKSLNLPSYKVSLLTEML